MPKFRKKPVVIEAERFTLDSDAKQIANWCGGTLFDNTPTRPFIKIQTLEGTMRAELGDWIIKGVAGEFYPCKPTIFADTYEPVE